MSVVGKRKSKKNLAVGFVLTAVSAKSSSEDDEVENDCSSEIGSSSAQPDENDENSDESTEEGSYSPEEFSENKETSETFVHTVSHKIALNLPRKPSANGLQNEDRVILHRFGGAAL